MDSSEAPPSSGGGGGGGGGGPAPFLLKTYDMVDDSSTDDIVSWSPAKTSFVVWNPPDFAARLLPTYFKHNNFSSFIRQLNTYGFRKIDPERWEFANDEFIEGQKHLLKNIHRRKPIHSHSHPPGSVLGDSERAALEDEIDRLSRERNQLNSDLWRFRQQQTATKAQLEDLERRLADMELRQGKMITFLQRAVQNPRFVENLVKMADLDFSAMHKKRRLPGLDCSAEVAESSSVSKPLELGFDRDFCDKLKLELCPAISESNLVTVSTHSSNEDDRCRQEEMNGGIGRMECLSFVPDSLELSDTGASLCPRKTGLLTGSMEGVDDGDELIPCHLNLTLASSSMQIDRNLSLSRNPNSGEQGAGSGNLCNEEEFSRVGLKNHNTAADSADGKVPSLEEAMPTSNQATPPAPKRVNDVFWEQFLTERPGSSDTEETSSNLRVKPSDEQQEEMKPGNQNMWRNRKSMEQLTL